jgi:hypothetical protein
MEEVIPIIHKSCKEKLVSEIHKSQMDNGGVVGYGV